MEGLMHTLEDAIYAARIDLPPEGQPGKIHNLFNVTTLLQAFPASFPCLLHPPPLVWI
jgi:hypothetical protein